MTKPTDKTQLIHITSDPVVTRENPAVISFSNWPDEQLPKSVVLEIYDRDRKQKGQPKSDDIDTGEDDVIAQIEGTIDAGPKGEPLFTRTRSRSVTAARGARDVVWFRFAGEAAASTTEAGIPFGSGETSTSEGTFYELAVRLRDPADTTKVIRQSSVSAVRRRAEVLLAVEPLCQGSTGMNDIAGRAIFDRFHPDEKQALRNRKWGSVILRVRDHLLPVLGVAGCSYAVVTMILRYLRVPHPDDPTETISLFDLHVDPTSLDDAYRPRIRKGTAPKKLAQFDNVDKQVQATIDHEKAWKNIRNAFVEKFRDRSKNKKAEKKRLKKLFDDTTGRNPETGGTTGLKTKVIEKNISSDDVIVPSADGQIKDHWYPAQLIWRLNHLEGRKDFDYDLRKAEVSAKKLGKLDDFSDPESFLDSMSTEKLMVDGKQAVIQSCEKRGKGGSYSSDAILLPLTKQFRKTFQLKSVAPHKKVYDYDAPVKDPSGNPKWAQAVIDALDRGLPVLGLFSPGSYSFRDSGGHFCLIVGYRTVAVTAPGAKPGETEVRFIINDPAKAAGLQYEALTERDLDPDHWTDPTAIKKWKWNDKAREKRGWNLIIERRMQLSLREIYIYEPHDGKDSLWDPDNRESLFWRGEVTGAEE